MMAESLAFEILAVPVIRTHVPLLFNVAVSSLKVYHKNKRLRTAWRV